MPTTRPPRHPARRLSRPATGATTLAAVVLATCAAGAASPAAHAASTPAAPTSRAAAAVAALTSTPELARGMMPEGAPDSAAGPGPAEGPRAAASTTEVQEGVDVSRWQHPYGGGDLDWSAVAASGQDFAVVKVTENGYVNPYFASDVKAAHDAGLVVGGYAFARPAASAIAQADAFTRTMGTLPTPSLPPVLDLEDDGGLSPSALVAWTHAFLDRVQANTGRIPMIYSGPSFWASAMGGDDGFTGYPLWEAHYTSAAAPAAMGGWPTYTLWQYTSSGSVPGIYGSVDRDRFRGTREQLAALGYPATQSRSAIDAKYTALGGSAGPLGAAVGSLETVPGGTAQKYARGTVYYSASTGAHAVYGGILAKYLAIGGPGALGLPTSDEVDANKVPGGRVNTFQRGNVYWSSATGAHGVYGAVLTRFLAAGGCAVMGVPTADETDTAGVSGGRVQTFPGGHVYWSAPTGARLVLGGVLQRFLAYGGTPALGLPTTDEGDVAGVPGGRVSVFRSGSVYWSDPTGAHVVFGGIREKYLAVGGPAAIGLPTTDEADAPGGRVSDFRSGTVYWTPSYGARAVYGGIREKYRALGGPVYLGMPTTDEVDVPGVPGARMNSFANKAAVYWSDTTAAHEVHGGIKQAFDAYGGAASLGLPTSDEYAVSGGRRSDFTGAYATWNSLTGLVVVTRR